VAAPRLRFSDTPPLESPPHWWTLGPGSARTLTGYVNLHANENRHTLRTILTPQGGGFVSGPSHDSGSMPASQEPLFDLCRHSYGYARWEMLNGKRVLLIRCVLCGDPLDMRKLRAPNLHSGLKRRHD
jgi:hypothetical protein